MKVIFLDIDGVLNCRQTIERWDGFIGIDPVLVKNFLRIIDETGAKVVLSSTWRRDQNWRDVMRKNGLTCKFLGRTNISYVPKRGTQIKEWLDECKKTIDKYVILDDDTDMLPGQKLFKTDFYNGGLTEEIAEKVIKYLNS